MGQFLSNKIDIVVLKTAILQNALPAIELGQVFSDIPALADRSLWRAEIKTMLPPNCKNLDCSSPTYNNWIHITNLPVEKDCELQRTVILQFSIMWFVANFVIHLRNIYSGKTCPTVELYCAIINIVVEYYVSEINRKCPGTFKKIQKVSCGSTMNSYSKRLVCIYRFYFKHYPRPDDIKDPNNEINRILKAVELGKRVDSEHVLQFFDPISVKMDENHHISLEVMQNDFRPHLEELNRLELQCEKESRVTVIIKDVFTFGAQNICPPCKKQRSDDDISLVDWGSFEAVDDCLIEEDTNNFHSSVQSEERSTNSCFTASKAAGTIATVTGVITLVEVLKSGGGYVHLLKSVGPQAVGTHCGHIASAGVMSVSAHVAGAVVVATAASFMVVYGVFGISYLSIAGLVCVLENDKPFTKIHKFKPKLI